jgi:hypothetical protein
VREPLLLKVEARGPELRARVEKGRSRPRCESSLHCEGKRKWLQRMKFKPSTQTPDQCNERGRMIRWRDGKMLEMQVQTKMKVHKNFLDSSRKAWHGRAASSAGVPTSPALSSPFRITGLVHFQAPSKCYHQPSSASLLILWTHEPDSGCINTSVLHQWASFSWIIVDTDTLPLRYQLSLKYKMRTKVMSDCHYLNDLPSVMPNNLSETSCNMNTSASKKTERE